MPPATAAPAGSSKDQSPLFRRKRFGKLIGLIAILAGLALGAFAFGMSRKWPFAQIPTLQHLREASDSEVQVRSFHQTYFPAPGCILEGLVFHHGPPGAKPLITIERLTIRGSYLGILSQRVSRITAEGMHVTILPFGTNAPFHTIPSKVTIEEIVANGATVEFDSDKPGERPLLFDIHEAFLHNVGWSAPLTYHLDVHNPEPPGEVDVQGKFGVWNLKDPGETPLSGTYTFENANLSVYEGVAGTLSSTGKFGGKLAHIDISGTTATPDFKVKSSSHPVALTTAFDAYVDATRGNTFLKRVTADFWKTHIVAAGSIATSPDGKGKTALIDLKSNDARIEDLLLLFIEEKHAPMSGAIAWRAHAEIPPGPQEFLRKVKLRGAFGIEGGEFSNSSTQLGVDKLSAGARGEKAKEREDPQTVLVNLKGQVGLVGGTATFSNLSFDVPGAHAYLHGTYNLINYRIDLRGQMRVDSKVSNTTDGSKAFFLKMMEPFFKKRRKGEIVPVRISGTYEHPTFGLDLEDKNARESSSR